MKRFLLQMGLGLVVLLIGVCFFAFWQANRTQFDPQDSGVRIYPRAMEPCFQAHQIPYVILENQLVTGAHHEKRVLWLCG